MSDVLSLCPLICRTFFALVILIFGKWTASGYIVIISFDAICNLNNFEQVHKFYAKSHQEVLRLEFLITDPSAPQPREIAAGRNRA
jgi:hypothetical protein